METKTKEISKETEAVLTEIKRVEEEAKIELSKAFEKIGNKKTTDFLEKFYYFPKQLCRMVIKGNSKGLILIGERGIGKSNLIIRTFQEENSKFCYHSGHITPLELYHLLYEHRKENILFDDANLFNNESNFNLLKACLGEIGVCSYKTSSSKLKVPNSFKFEGTITICLNHKPKSDEDLKAVESRILSYELELTYAEKIRIMEELATLDYKDLKPEERQEIITWIKKNTSLATDNLNLRILFQIYEFYRFDKANFQLLAQKIIKNDKNMELLLSGLSEYYWCEKTGLSRRSYYNYKKKCEVSAQVQSV